MSQGGILQDKTSAAANVEFLTGDVGGPVGPDALFNINLLTGHGLTSTGVPASNTITFTRDDNPYEGTGQTIGAVTANLITIPLGATPTTYSIECRVAGFESTTPAGATYLLVAGFRTTGIAATLIGTVDRTTNEDAALLLCNANMIASGNNVIIQVTGVAGLTINWRAQSVQTAVA